MSRPIVIAHHLIWTLYGWWLPNDPRGSCSHTIRSEVLRPLGELHYGRKRLQPASREIRTFYSQARTVLAHPLLDLDDQRTITSVATGFAAAILQFNYTCYACAVLFDHVHLVIRKHKHSAEQMIEHLQSFSRLQLLTDGFRPPDHPTWCRGGWKIFLDNPDEVRRTIKYVEDNPLPYRQPRQHWPFVKPYDNWPFHRGHNPHSPYARRRSR